MKKMKNNMISVIIPCYNTGKYLNDVLNSLQNQTYKNFEVIIIDDGSTDNTKNIVSNFEKNNALMTIKYYYKANGGVSSARNYCIKKSIGDYIVFIDSDDVLDYRMLELLVEKADKNSSDFVVSNANLSISGKISQMPFRINNDKISNYELMACILSSKLANMVYSINYNFGRSVCAKLYNRSIIIKNNIRFDEKMYLFEDGFFNLTYLSKVDSVSFVDTPLYTYMIEHGNSKKFRKNLVNENEYKILVLKNFIDIEETDDGILHAALDVFLIDLFYAFVGNFLNNPESNLSFFEKLKSVRNVYIEFFKNYFKFNIFKYLNFKKKILFLVTKLHFNILLILILKKRG